jgi:formylglycine-generating enzyme required for sulfatase activity
MAATYDHVYLRRLRQLIDRHFDLEETRTLCFDLGLRYDGLRGEDKTAKVRELVDFMDRQGRLDELVELCQQERPKIEWQEKTQHGGTGDTEKEKNEEWGTQEKGTKPGENLAETGGPEWVEIPAGEFWLGSEKGRDWEKPMHRLHLDTFWIARTPVTKAQYRLFLQAAGHAPPVRWNGLVLEWLEHHPIIDVSWNDAMAYCRWLSGLTGKRITLPSEAEWEKAARGDQDMREYPWGDIFDPRLANGKETKIGTTSPVGSFGAGASPYGVLDMSGNVWEWTRSVWDAKSAYPYVVEERQTNFDGGGLRVLRGGSWSNDQSQLRCAFRSWYSPNVGYNNLGFRIVALPSSSGL